jgi:hypothetical protein
MKSRLAALLLALLCAIMVLPAAAGAQAREGVRYFPATGKSVRGEFLHYWQRNGGLPRQGYPISSELMERSETDGKMYAVQYFERAIFEFHPDAEPPHKVQLSLLGVFSYERRYPGGAPEQVPNAGEGSRFFAQTGKRVGGGFLQYWQRNGGLPQFGYPISDEFSEQSDLDGNVYTVQYFERAVFEWHPEMGPQSRVLLSQLGTYRFRARYGGVEPGSGLFSSEEIDYFAEVALGTEFGGSAAVVARWARPMRVKVNGAPTPADLQTLRQVVQDLNAILGDGRVSIVERDPNVNLHFVPRRRFAEVNPDYVSGNEGFVTVFWDAEFRIYRGTVLITTEGISQRERSHLIREELTQGLGLLKDSNRYPESIFYQPWTDTQFYAPIDRTLIRMLYHPALRPGMNEIEVRATFNSLAARGRSSN